MGITKSKVKVKFYPKGKRGNKENGIKNRDLKGQGGWGELTFCVICNLFIFKCI